MTRTIDKKIFVVCQHLIVIISENDNDKIIVIDNKPQKIR